VHGGHAVYTCRRRVRRSMANWEKILKVFLAVVAAVTVLVFAGLDRASFSLGYTGMVAAVGMVGLQDDTRLARVARAFAHPVVLISVVGATAQDVAGYPHVPWFLVVMCWCLAYWVSANASFAKGHGCMALAAVGFITGLCQYFDSA